MNKKEWISDKILDRDAAARRCRVWQAAGKKVVFTNGCFDVLHRGHLEYLADAAGKGNVLIIGVNSDASVTGLKGPSRPVIREKDRLYALAALQFVDGVVVFNEETPLSLIELLRPDVVAKGGDYTVDTIVGAQETLARGGSVEVIPFVEGYSTTAFLDKISRL